ncbi:DUF1206 domain-containing protein [Herbiconiux sp. A18JL235]|uniref:DUF1206 domain-containing protein n=1 Tax=Herbiconiux sp. A18JL235 TaxID=3152363 RepID=A0AB39BBW2_9MICO
MSTRATANRAMKSAANSKGLEMLARVGFGASALVHILLGYLAIRVASNGGGESDQSGAMAEITKLPGGTVLIWVVTIGLFALALWLVVEAITGIGSASDKRWVRSLVPAGKAVAYAAVGITALTFAMGQSTSNAESTQQTSASILQMPGGQILLGVVGVAVVGIGGYFVFKGVTKKFEEDLTMPSGTVGRVVRVMGVVGYVAKGIAVGVMGILFVVAAVKVDPENATGLDGALKSLVELPFGVVILVAVGVGLIAYGLYTVVRARFARL